MISINIHLRYPHAFCAPCSITCLSLQTLPSVLVTLASAFWVLPLIEQSATSSTPLILIVLNGKTYKFVDHSKIAPK